MRDLMAKKETNRPIPKAVLKALWHVDADPAYRVHRKPNCFDCEYIAVRTLTGTGRTDRRRMLYFDFIPSHIQNFHSYE